MQNEKINKVLTITALITALLFVTSIFFLTIQVYNNSGTDSATILSGVLSMFGGALGALGAYFVATHQTKKQFEKEDRDRALELRIEKLNEALMITNDFLHHLQMIKGKFGNIERFVGRCIKYGSEIIKSAEFNESIIKELLIEIKECDAYKNELKKYKIFTPKNLYYQQIYDITSELIDSYKDYFHQFDRFRTQMYISDELKSRHPMLVIECDIEYKKLEEILEGVIEILESEIQKLLNLN